MNRFIDFILEDNKRTSNTSKAIFSRIIATLEIDNGWSPFSNSVCYGATAEYIKNNETPDGANVALLSLDGSNIPMHSILLDKEHNIIQDSYERYRLKSQYPEYVYDIPRVGERTYKVTSTANVYRLRKGISYN